MRMQEFREVRRARRETLIRSRRLRRLRRSAHWTQAAVSLPLHVMQIGSFAHDLRAAQLAQRLYHNAAAERPDWIDEALLRPGQVALLFQVSRRTISDWARVGKIDAIITPGGHRRFRARDVRKLLAGQQVWSGSSAPPVEEPRSRAAL